MLITNGKKKLRFPNHQTYFFFRTILHGDCASDQIAVYSKLQQASNL